MNVEVKPKRARRARQREEPLPPDTQDPIEIAMKAVAAGAESSGPARMVLEKHACLIDIQCRRESEELGNVRVQRITRWLILGAVATLLAGVAGSLWAASRSSSLVIEEFQVPPGLAQRGLNGRVVSARVLDRLAQLQRETESMRGEKSYAENWQDDIKLDIPQTGVSLGEAWRTMKGWLGQQTRIGGEIVETPAGLAITTRAGSLSGGTVEGPAADVEALLGKAAKAIYKATQPYRYAISLPPEEVTETEQVLLGLTGDPSPLERKWAYSGLSATYRSFGQPARALAMAKRALAIDPELLPALGNLGRSSANLGHDEAMLDAFRRFEKAYHKAESGEYDKRISEANRVSADAMAAWALADPPRLRRNADAMEGLGSLSTFAAEAASIRADAAAMTHDLRGAATILAQLTKEPVPYAAAGAQRSLAFLALVRAAQDRDRKAALAAAAEAERIPPPTDAAPLPLELHLPARAAVAIELARAGAAGEAQARAQALPEDCYDCVRARGWAALANGYPRGAIRWFREAIRQGPSLPRAYADLGEALLAAGDPAGAERHFVAAHAKAGNWPDALKLWGDSALKQRSWQEAEQRYRAAAARAPRWAAAHIMWAEALWRLGRRDEARAKLQAAGRMDLRPRERAQLQAMLRKAERRS